MVNSAEDLESQLLRLDRKFERLEDGTVLVRISPNQPPAALRLSEPVLVAQVEIGKIPAIGQAELFRTLLEFNGSSLLHAAYAIAEDTIILVAALELVSLDPNELDAVLSDFDLALSAHVPQLKSMVGEA
jgi:hypothetical protein